MPREYTMNSVVNGNAKASGKVTTDVRIDDDAKEDNDVDDKDVEIQVDLDDDLDFDETCYSKGILSIQNGISGFYRKHKKKIWTVIKVLFLLGYMAYFSYCMYYSFGDEGSIRLLVGTSIGVLYIVNKLTPGCGNVSCLQRFSEIWGGHPTMLIVRRWLRRSLYVLFTIGAGLYIGFEVVKSNPENIQSLLGIGGFVVIGFIISTSPARVNWHPVFWGIGIQFVFALIILRTGWGYTAFDWLGDRVEEFLAYGYAGAKFVFGDTFREHRLAMAAMSIMLFFNSIIFLLYHIGVIQSIIKTMGSFLAFCLDTGPVESVVASANIFIGLSEAPLLVRPFLKSVTPSELHAIMTCGFASVAGGVLGTYVQFGVPANHLLSASVMSAPAALAMTKLMCPETKKSAVGVGTKLELGLTKHRNALSAISSGAVAAVKVAANTLSNQIAFVSVLKFADMTLEWFGDRAGVAGLSFELVCSYLFFPLSYIMGVAVQDCAKMSAMIGKKIFGTPIMGYIDLGILRNNRKALVSYINQQNGTWNWVGGNVLLHATNVTLVGGVLDERSEVIGTYALCGFSTVVSMGVALGTLGAMAPERKPDIVRLVVRALVAGNMASFLTGAIAGLMFNGTSFA